MRVVLALGLVGASLSAAAGVSFACSVIRSYTFMFPAGSADLDWSNQRTGFERKLAQLAPPGTPLKCYRFLLEGDASKTEVETAAIRLDVARTEAVRETLLRAGAPKESMGTINYMASRQPSGDYAEIQNRRVEVTWKYAEGQWRCDPATKQESFPPACIGEYGACYYELVDGTVCNFQSAPDPNPQRYSVIQ